MPITDAFAEKLITELRVENAALLELLLKQSKVLPAEETEVRVDIPVQMQSLGKEPWYMRQARLERRFRKPRLSEISGIPDVPAQESVQDILEGESQDAGSIS